MDITKLIPPKLRQEILKPSEDLDLKDNSIEIPTIEANPMMDTVIISDEARELGYDYKQLMEEWERSKEAVEGAAEYYDEYLKCLQIAMRILSGDRVPLKDEKFLAEKQPELYLKAILMKRTKIDPKKYKSLIPDEEDDDIISDISDSDEINISTSDDSSNVEVEVSLDIEE